MATRRQFLKQLGVGMAAGAVSLPFPSGPLFGMPSRGLQPPPVRIALLADSHLPNADINSSAAKNLSAAVTEINALNPPADLVLVAGDLTDSGDAEALRSGREIISSLVAPCWLVPGEKDYLSPAAWKDTFGYTTFSFTHRGVHFLGFNTARHNTANHRNIFHIIPEQLCWLARKLETAPPQAPLVLLTHAPLYRLFQPWQWWTEHAESLHDILRHRQNVLLLHGHVHQNVALRLKNLTFQGLRSTAWPLPDVRLGFTTSQPSPQETGSRTGCGWMLVTIDGHGEATIKDQVWEI